MIRQTSMEEEKYLIERVGKHSSLCCCLWVCFVRQCGIVPVA